jgi:hypothetical protein
MPRFEDSALVQRAGATIRSFASGTPTPSRRRDAWSPSEVALICGTGVLALAVYVGVGASRLTPPNDIDPWLYTGFFNNFRFLYHTFGYTYYASRLPYLLPGWAINSLLPPVPAHYVYHGILLIAGGLGLYVGLRPLVGRISAFAAYASLLGSVLYYDSHITDYYDGAATAFVLIGLGFALPAAAGVARRPRLRYMVGGAFFWAAITTNLFTSVIVAPLVLVWVALVWPDLSSRRWRAAFEPVVLAAFGAAILSVALGILLSSVGGDFLYFKPQLSALHSVAVGAYKLHGYHWMVGEPRLLLPILLVALILVQGRRLRARWQTPGARLAAGVAAYLAFVYAFYCVWEFAFTGIFLDIPYYFSYLNVGIALGVASAVYLVWDERERKTRGNASFVALIIAASFLPMVLIAQWAAPGFMGRNRDVLALTVVAVALVAVGTRIGVRRRPATAAVVSTVLTVLAVNTAAAVSQSAAGNFNGKGQTPAVRGATLNLAVDLIDYLRRSGVQSQGAPSFWYDIAASPIPNALNSLYLWQYTWIGLEMPKVDDTVRANLLRQHPDHLVILCVKEPLCAAGAAALPQLGVRASARKRTVLRSGSYHVIVDVYRLLWSASQSREAADYAAAATVPAPAPHGRVLTRWSFVDALPSTWQSSSGVSVKHVAGALNVTTTPGRYDYVLQTDASKLPSGEYALLVHGRVDAGGIEVGVLDLQTSSWLVNPRYWSGQRSLSTLPMVARFTIAQPRALQFVLQNWGVLGDRVSRWTLRDAELVRVSP